VRRSAVVKLRLGFGAKILLALVGTVVLLTGTSLWVVGHQTRTQVDWLVGQTLDHAGRALAEVEELRNETLEPLASRFVFGIRFQAAMDAALDEDDPSVLLDAARYEIELTALDQGVASFTDIEGRVLVTLLGGEPVLDEPDADDDPMVRAILGGREVQVAGYRLFRGELFSVQTYLLDFFGEPLGTLTLGFPADDELARRLGEVVRAEVCFVVEGRCVAGTPAAGDPDLQARMAEAAGASEPLTAEWDGRRWALVSTALSAEVGQAGGPPGTASDPEAGGRGSGGVFQVLAVPLDDVLLPFDRIREVERWAGLGALFLAVLLGVGLSRGLVRPVRTLVAATDRVRQGDYEFHVDVPSRDEMGQLAEAFNEMLGDLALKERYRGVLDKVVSKDVADEMLRGEIRLGGETREVTTLFADVRGFTSLSEGMESQEIIAMLNEWFDQAARVVESAGGVVDKFLGDGLMAIFGAPIHQPDHAARAIRAALGMRDGLDDVNRERKARGQAPILVGIGIATGPVVAGNAGSHNRLNYTVLGPSVNLAARLCGAAEAGEILVSPETRKGAEVSGADLDAVEEPARELKGVSKPVRPWSVRGLGAAAALLGALVVGGAALTPASAGAQWFPFDPPTLTEAGVEYISPSGFFQLFPSGQLDLEGYFPGDEPAWLIPETDAFFSARLRLFLDAFFGDRVYASVEGRADRGDEPTADDFTARLQQAFVRVRIWDAGALHLQAGQFTTPFGNHPTRRRTEADPFIRPPLAYDHPTVLRTHEVPVNEDELLGWKDDPWSRAQGVAAVWGTPYPTGVMLMGAWRDVDLRVAVVNSAPSAEPDLWKPSAPFGSTQIIRLGWQIVPSFHLGVSQATGPWIREWVDDPFPDAEDPVPADRFRTYKQKLLGVESTFTRGMVELRGEVFMNRWGLPEMDENPKELSWYAEGKVKSAGGLFGAVRFGAIHFGDVTGSGGTAEPWDHDIQRIQVGAGYRLARNLEIRGEYLMNRSSDAPLLETELGSIQLWWRF
jgi:class 3 adenylate cyclase